MSTTARRQQPVPVELPPYGVFVFESHHTGNFRMGASSHDFLEIFYVLQGRGVFVIEGRPHACRPGDLVVVPARQEHHIEDDPGAPLSLYGVCVAPSVWRHDPGLPGRLPAGCFAGGDLFAGQVRGDLRRLLFEQTLARPAGNSIILGVALQLLGLLARALANARPDRSAASPPPTTGHREAVRRYLAELPSHFFEAADIDHLAARLGMSRRAFTRLFRELAGDSWSATVHRLRIEYGCRLLRETTRSIVEIAFECGYEDLTGFYRAFKRHTGQPPNRWRQKRGSG